MSENITRITVAQLNFPVGDIDGNTQKIISAAQKARDELKADLIVFPELALSGYPAEDLLLRTDFQLAIDHALRKINQEVTGIAMVIGYPEYTIDGIYNAVTVIHNQTTIAKYHKQCLPNFGVFEEKRYFKTGSKPCVFTLKNIPIGIIVCEDLWHPEPARQAANAGAQLILCPNASPFDFKKPALREKILGERVAENKLPIIYVHSVGAQDDLIFDGGSMAMNPDGTLAAHAGFYSEKLLPIEITTQASVTIKSIKLPEPLNLEASIYQALVLGVREYIHKNNFSEVLIGLSGGIDSALTLAVAVDALGKEQVEAVALPSRYTSELSMNLLQEQAALLGIKLRIISIEPCFQAFLSTLELEKVPLDDVTQQNLQSRCRGTLLMALSNSSGKIVLNTSNKSEMAAGYGTLYGDMIGGYAVLKDVPKTLVFKLAHYRNTLSPAIPEKIIERPPTAELAPNQKDEDHLPPYNILDSIIEMYVEQDKSCNEIIAAGFSSDIVKKIIKLIDRNEYKRRQTAPGPRVTPRAFSRERRYPITSQFKAWNSID